jgi:hypothetical protein
LLAHVAGRWPVLVGPGGERLALAALCAYSLWDLAEDAVRGKVPPGPGTVRRAMARIKRRFDTRWLWRTLPAEGGAEGGWVYLPQLRPASWRGTLRGVCEQLRGLRPGLGLVFGEEISRGGGGALGDVGEVLVEPRQVSWRIDVPSAPSAPGSWPGPAGLIELADRLMPIWLDVVCRWLATLEGLWRDRPAALVMVVNDLERMRRGACMLAKARGVPVVNLQHGVINRSGHYALGVADLHLLWGPAFEENLIAAGADASALRVIGAPLYDALAEAPRPRAAPNERVCLLYAAQPPSGELPAETCRQVIDLHADLARAHPEMDVILRSHPRDSADTRREVAELVGKVANLHASQEARVADAIEHCHVVSTIFSTVTIDAAVARRPSVLLDFAGEGHRFPLDRRPPFFAADRPEELCNAVVRAAVWAASPSAEEGWQWFDRHVLNGLDGQATNRAAQAVAELLERKCQV